MEDIWLGFHLVGMVQLNGNLVVKLSLKQACPSEW